MDEFSDLEESSNVGKIIGMVILLLAILGAIGYYLYNKFYINKPVIDDVDTVVSNKIDDEKDDIYYIDYTKYEISYTDKDEDEDEDDDDYDEDEEDDDENESGEDEGDDGEEEEDDE